MSRSGGADAGSSGFLALGTLIPAVLAAVSLRRAGRRLADLATAAAVGTVGDAVVVPVSAPPAFLARDRIVVSAALVAALPSDELAAVLAHEAAHLRGGHARLAPPPPSSPHAPCFTTQWLTADVLACAGLTALLTYLLRPLRTHA